MEPREESPEITGLATGDLRPSELLDAWPFLSPDERLEGFKLLPHEEAEDLFLSADARTQAEIIGSLPPAERRLWMRALPPDDAVDLLQAVSPEMRDALIALLDAKMRSEVIALLAYAEDDAGGLMNPRFARVRPDMTVGEAIGYLRRQAREPHEAPSYVYVIEPDQKLVGVVSFRTLFFAPPETRVRDIMSTDLITVPEQMDQEVLSRLFAQHDLIAIPVVDPQGRMKGIVTVDDIVDVVAQEATEDAQKYGGMEALEAPYMAVGFWEMIRKRAGWLSALFIGEMLTASAMGYFEDEIARAVILALFVPLIISSGGNSGSQASTLVIRSLALGEIRPRDWWRVMGREIRSGITLGGVLGTIGFIRIVLWQKLFGSYGDQYLLVALTVALSLLGVVTFGTLAGSMLPFLLQRLRLDPASASAPFVATLVDVTGLIIYFTAAAIILGY